VATRKLGVEADVGQRRVEIMARMRVVRFEARDVVAAIELHRLHRISFWDSMILCRRQRWREQRFCIAKICRPGRPTVE